jgi:hypothetical protein
VNSETKAKRNNWSPWFIGELIMGRSYFHENVIQVEHNGARGKIYEWSKWSNLQ